MGIGTTTTPQKNAVQVKTNSSTFLTGIVGIATGGTHSLALKSDGTVWAWGLNSSGQLGNGTTTNQSYAVQVKLVGGAALTGIADIAAGANHSLARKTDGTLWAWGSNANGQLADGTTNPVSTSKQLNAVQVKASSTIFLNGVNGLAGGASFSLALKIDGTLWSWGLNSSNQLGDGTSIQRVFPVQVKDTSGAFVSGIVDLFGGASHSLATKADGTAWGWGLNSLGQTGSMSTSVNPNVATQIVGGSIPFMIIVGFDDPDRDTLLTWQEREAGTNPNLADTDGDGIPDGYEVSRGLNPLVNDAYDDPDHDYFLNVQEYAAGTNPQNPDTDADGALDGEDIYALDPHFALKKMPVSTYTVVEAVGGGPGFGSVTLNNLNSILYNQVFVWSGGTPIVLNTVDNITATGMNDSGQIVGYKGGPPTSRAVMGSRPGSFRDLSGGHAGAINNSGVVVGWAYFDQGDAAARLDTGPPPTLLGLSLRPTAMNDAGDVVGEVVQYYTAAIGSGGITTALSEFTYPYAVNNDRYVAGTNWGIYNRTPLVWHDGETLHLPVPFNTKNAEAYGIDKNGLMVGYAYSNNADYTALLWQNGQSYDMTYQLDADSTAAGWVIQRCWAINDHGVIAATAFRSGFNGLILLLPTPAVQLITPSGDPINAPVDAATDGQNEVTFNNSNPGVLAVHLKAKVLAAGTAAALASRCRFTIDTIGTSTMAWGPSNPGGQPTNTSGDYLEADVTFTGLPANNSDFGRKKVTITVDGGVRDQKAMEVFYPKNGTNHPAGQIGAPNWYHYWEMTSANYGTHSWASGGGTGYTDFIAGSWQAFIQNAAQHTQGGTWSAAAGIDLYANLCRHEETHRLQLIGMWGVSSGVNAADDIDGDYLKDSVEATLVPGHPYDPNNAATYLDTFNYTPSGGNLRDVEDYCLLLEPAWINGTANAGDWAAPGMQHLSEGNPDD